MITLISMSKIEKMFLFFERWGVNEGFHFSFGVFKKVDLSLGPFGAGFEMHNIVSYNSYILETPIRCQ